MVLYALLAVLCAAPCVTSMFLPPNFHPSFELGYEAPDPKILRRNAFGQLQSHDVSTDHHFVRNAAGGISRYDVMEISADPDILTNTVGGGPFGLNNPFMSITGGGFGTSGLGPTGLVASGLGMGGLGMSGLRIGGLGMGGLSIGGLGMGGLGTSGLTATGLGTRGLVTNGLSTTGLGTRGLVTNGLSTTGLGTRGFGTTGLSTTGLGTAGLRTAGALNTPARANTLKMPVVSTLNNYVSSYPFRLMFS